MMAWNSQERTCLCLLCAVTKSMYHHAQLALRFDHMHPHILCTCTRNSWSIPCPALWPLLFVSNFLSSVSAAVGTQSDLDDLISSR